MNKNKSLKSVPMLPTDEVAETFVETADLSQFNLSGFKPVQFELAAKDQSIHLRLPAPLLQTIKTAAAKQNIPYSRLIRITLEQALTAKVS
jgi:predicted DNA binding CopG/RHH family protein